MTNRFRYLPLLAGLLGGLICGCGPEPTAKTTAAEPTLRFPAILVWTGESARIVWPENALKTMHVNYVTGHQPQPVVIDSDLNIYDLLDLRMTQSGLALMLNPNGVTPIAFTLKPHASQGLDAARGLINGCQWLGVDGSDGAEKRDAIAKAESLEEMIAILRPEAPATTSPE